MKKDKKHQFPFIKIKEQREMLYLLCDLILHTGKRECYLKELRIASTLIYLHCNINFPSKKAIMELFHYLIEVGAISEVKIDVEGPDKDVMTMDTELYIRPCGIDYELLQDFADFLFLDPKEIHYRENCLSNSVVEVPLGGYENSLCKLVFSAKNKTVEEGEALIAIYGQEPDRSENRVKEFVKAINRKAKDKFGKNVLQLKNARVMVLQ